MVFELNNYGREKIVSLILLKESSLCVYVGIECFKDKFYCFI